MKVYDIALADGRVAAFQVDNAVIGRRGFCRIVESIPSANMVRRPKFLSWFREDVFCEFSIAGALFEAEEPYGDNDRYWVGPAGTGIDDKPLVYLPQVEALRAAFARA